jgi:serine/threonine protein kinase
LHGFPSWLISRGDLKRCLGEVTSIAKRVDLVHDVATGLSWLQHCKIVHRDLKLDNLLVSEDWTVKITYALMRFRS